MAFLFFLNINGNDLTSIIFAEVKTSRVQTKWKRGYEIGNQSNAGFYVYSS